MGVHSLLRPHDNILKVIRQFSNGCCFGLCTVAFFNGVYKPMDFDIVIGNDIEIFSSH